MTHHSVTLAQPPDVTLVPPAQGGRPCAMPETGTTVGIMKDRDLAASYERCRALHRAYGRTYYLATRLLPAWKRPHVHALYGFTRYTDEIVDGPDDEGRAERLRWW